MTMTAAERGLPKLRQDLKLYQGPHHRDGSPSWRILDPVRNRFFEVGWLEFELLARWSGHENTQTLIEQVIEETPLHPSEDEVAGFVDFLVANQLVVANDPGMAASLRTRWLAARRPWYERLFHNYLFFRIPLLRPDRFLDRMLPLAQIFYTRAFAVAVLLVLGVDLYLLNRDFTELHRSFVQFFTLEGGLYFAIAATFSKLVHEFAHACTAKRYGVRVPTMGLALLVLWPFLYTDTGETWKLADRRKQLAIASAGIVAELVLACFATLLWAISPDGTMKTIFFILATTTWVLTLAINASPFMRFDGYFVLSDALDFPNLHERSFACARWWIRTRFFRLDQPLPEPALTAGERGGLVFFALLTWLYRFVVFIGIALLVYYLFYKPLGVVLMALEVWWFILRPVGIELAYLWARRGRLRFALIPFAVLLAVVALLAWLVPVAREVSAPAVLFAQGEQALYAPFAARIRSVEVKPGQAVKAGQVLLQLESPDLQLRERNAEVVLATSRLQSIRGAANTKQQERSAVFAEQVAHALAQQRAVREEKQRLEVRASSDGVVRDMAADIVPGRWIGAREILMRLVPPAMNSIEAYVSDAQVHAVRVGQEVRFFPAVPGMPVVRGRVKAIDPTAQRTVPRPLLASTHGGELAALPDKRAGSGLVAQNAIYRVVIEIEPPVDTAGFVTRGTVRIRTDLWLVAENLLSRALSVIVRESGI